MTKEKFSIKKAIEQNRDNINEILSSSATWISYSQWVQNQLLKENERLFPQNKAYLYYCKEQKMRKNCLATSFTYISKNAGIDVIDYNQIRTIHQLISEGTDVAGGVIRFEQVDLRALNIDPPNMSGIYHKLEELQYNISRKDIDPISKAFQVHYDIVAIQPFEDFNKRTARMIMNWVLIKDGFTPLLFNKAADRALYLSAIRCKNCGPKKEYEKTFLNVMLRSQHQIIEFLCKLPQNVK